MFVFVLLAVIPIISLGIKALIDQKASTERQVLSSNLEISRILAQEIDKFIKNAQKILDSTTKIPDLAYLPEDRPETLEVVKTVLETTVTNFDIFAGLYVMDIYGQKGVYAENKQGIIRVRDLDSADAETLRKASWHWYSDVVRGKHTDIGFITPVFFTNIRSEPRIRMSMFIKTRLHEIVGVIVAELDLKSVAGIVNQIRIGETGLAYVVDDLGRVIAHGDRDIVPGTTFVNKPEVMKLMSHQEGAETFTDKSGGVLAAYVPVSKFNTNQISRYFALDWGVVVLQDAREAFAAADRMRRTLVTWVLGFIFLALALAAGFSWTITNPLNKLVKGANTISQGDLSQPLRLKSRDELGDLALVFDQMRLNLQKKMDDLKILYEVGQAISSVLDYKELLHLILDKNMKVIDAERGSIMLFDDENKLVIQAAQGIPAKIVQNTRVSHNEGVAGWVIKTGEPLLVKDTSREAGFEKLKGRKVDRGCMLSVPLKVKDKNLGVMNVSKSIPDSFDKKDLELYKALATQAAIAIENARLYRMAITDGLTKLFIHRYFQQRMDEELSRSRRYNEKLSYIMLDIDHFKNFNDTFGHQVGDKVLVTVARLLEASVREIDILARYGGEEFAIILPEKTKKEAAVAAERMRKKLEDNDFMVEGKRVPITISLGIAEFPADANEKTDLIEKADLALYYSKETGRNKVSQYDESMKAFLDAKKSKDQKKGKKPR